MSIEKWQIQTYKEGVIMALQQKRSKLRDSVRDDGKLVGKRVFFDLLAATSMSKRTVRNQPTVLTDQTHNRRSGTMDFYDLHMTVDPIDVHRIGSDPSSSYQQNGVMACQRQIDDVIIAQMLASAWENETGSSEVVYDTANQLIANGGIGLTKDKIIECRKKFEAALFDADEQLYWAYGAEQLEDLLNITEVVNNDYNIKALQDGRVVYFCGFNWVPTQRLPVSGGIRQTVAWVRSGIGFHLGQGMDVQINKRPDLSNVDQISISIDLGAVRTEDAKVIRVDCVE